MTTLAVVDEAFWTNIAQWEPHTFDIFARYIDAETTVIDFGAWIGPTLLFHALLSKKSYGIEGDPVAFAQLKANVQLNVPLFDGMRRVELLPACIATNHSMLQMNSANAGNSCSGLGTVACGAVTVRWSVQCFRLSELFVHWHLRLTDNVFVKIDVESYECELIPSFVAWLSSAERKPTLYIAFHGSNVAACSVAQYTAIDELVHLYAYAHCVGTDQSGKPAAVGIGDSRYDARIGFYCFTGELLLTDRRDASVGRMP